MSASFELEGMEFVALNGGRLNKGWTDPSIRLKSK